MKDIYDCEAARQAAKSYNNGNPVSAVLVFNSVRNFYDRLRIGRYIDEIFARNANIKLLDDEKFIYVDPYIARAVAALNLLGYPTDASCHGHVYRNGGHIICESKPYIMFKSPNFGIPKLPVGWKFELAHYAADDGFPARITLSMYPIEVPSTNAECKRISMTLGEFYWNLALEKDVNHIMWRKSTKDGYVPYKEKYNELIAINNRLISINEKMRLYR